MAQVIDRTVGANPTGFDMRTELNNIIGALESDNSGSSEPLNTVAYMKWLDTSNATYYYYKERNHDNTAWVTLFRYTVATKIMDVVSNGVVLQDSALVHKTGDETIAGVKTFSSSPIVPTPTTGTQAANKDYVDSKATLPIGAILNGYTIFENCIVAFGGEFNRADYPKLWAYLQANPTLVKTQAEWQAESTANGGICGFFSYGNGTTTFRVPNLDKAFLRPDSRGVGTYQGDAIRNITGHWSSHGNEYIGIVSLNTTGVFKAVDVKSRGTLSSLSTGTAGLVGFDASLVVPTANENIPKNIAVLPLIVAK